MILLMAEILHQLIGSSSHYIFVGFLHPRWLAGFQPSTVSGSLTLVTLNHLVELQGSLYYEPKQCNNALQVGGFSNTRILLKVQNGVSRINA